MFFNKLSASVDSVRRSAPGLSKKLFLGAASVLSNKNDVLTVTALKRYFKQTVFVSV